MVLPFQAQESRFVEIEQVHERKPVKQGLLDQAVEIEQGEAVFGLELDVGQKQVVAHGQPYLSEDRVLGSAEKSFDLKILFDPSEEGFDLPTRLVDGGNGGGR